MMLRMTSMEDKVVSSFDSLSLSLSQCYPFILRGMFYIYDRFSTPAFYPFFGVGLPAYFSNHNPFFEGAQFCGF